MQTNKMKRFIVKRGIFLTIMVFALVAYSALCLNSIVEAIRADFTPHSVLLKSYVTSIICGIGAGVSFYFAINEFVMVRDAIAYYRTTARNVTCFLTIYLQKSDYPLLMNLIDSTELGENV